MKVPVYNLEGRVVEEIDLPENVFGVHWNADLVHQALLAQQANRRTPLAHTKMRGEVSGGGKKPWRQKGTGRARHGSIRSPIWKGGGVTHGPRNDKDYSVKLNRKMKRLAIRVVLSKKLADSELKVVDSFALSAPKTKELFQALSKFLRPATHKPLPSALLIPALSNKSVYRAAANIPKVRSISPLSLNVEDLLKHKNILVEKDAALAIK